MVGCGAGSVVSTAGNEGSAGGETVSEGVGVAILAALMTTTT